MPPTSDLDSTIVQLANNVREVFGAQTARHTVHAFTLCGTDLRAWHFEAPSQSGLPSPTSTPNHRCSRRDAALRYHERRQRRLRSLLLMDDQ